MIYGGIFHGQCENKVKCTNCRVSHKSNFKKYREYLFNIQLKQIMADKNISAYNAASVIKGNRRNRYPRPEIS